MNRKKLAGQLLLLLLLWLSACSRPEAEEASDSRSLDAWPVPEGEEMPKATEKPQEDSIAYDWKDGYLLLSWKTLAQVTFDWEFSGELEAEVPVPNFSKTVLALEEHATLTVAAWYTGTRGWQKRSTLGYMH